MITKDISFAFVLITYNSYSLIEKWLSCVTSTISRTNKKADIFIIDNGSSDRSTILLRDLCNRNILNKNNIIITHHNNGFNRAFNWMVKEKELYTMYSHISLVNIDAKIEEEWLVKMIKNIENNDEKSLFGCKILDIDNRQKISSLGHIIDPDNGKTYDVGWNVDNKCCEKHISAILTPCFAASVFPVSCFNNVGFPNNDQWMYYDDIEYYIRCIRAGYNTVFDKNICAYHPLPMKKSSKRIIKAQEEGKEKMIEISRDIKKNDKALYEKIKYKWDIEKKLRKDLTPAST
ncbi:MAG TPA: glycosyltransferase [Bacteroidales bacterium]|nr:glycosyltransferase [Bacteroidales bacterium]